jgi:hypothetical protein
MPFTRTLSLKEFLNSTQYIAHFLDERTLIVLDEPEVHLHPNWQLKYAEIITLLVKNNILHQSKTYKNHFKFLRYVTLVTLVM